VVLLAITAAASLASAAPTTPTTRPADAPMPVWDSMLRDGKPSSRELGLVPVRYAYWGYDKPETWNALADDAAGRGLVVFANTFEADPTRWSEFATSLRARQPGAQVGVYNQLTRTYWPVLRLYKALREQGVAGVPTTLDELRSFYRQGNTLWSLPELWKLAGSEAEDPRPRWSITGWQTLAGEVAADSRLGEYVAWQEAIGDFVWHDDRRVLDQDFLPQSVYLFHPVGPAAAYLYAAENLISHQSWLRGSGVGLVAVVMPKYHGGGGGGGFMTDHEAAAVTLAARDAGCVAIAIWSGNGPWTAEHQRVVRAVARAAQSAEAARVRPAQRSPAPSISR
jgi:hypothetical protein